MNQPRQIGRAGYPLPSPRMISNIIHKSGHCSLPSRRFTVLAMQFGQFIEHDVISTPIQRGVFHILRSHTSIFGIERKSHVNIQSIAHKMNACVYYFRF